MSTIFLTVPTGMVVRDLLRCGPLARVLSHPESRVVLLTPGVRDPAFVAELSQTQTQTQERVQIAPYTPYGPSTMVWRLMNRRWRHARTAGQADAIQEGKALYDRYGCADCHRTERGGGRGLPVVDDEWVFGGDDETLFKLIRRELPGQTIPATPGKDLPEAEIRKMLAYIRSLYQGDPSKITW